MKIILTGSTFEIKDKGIRASFAPVTEVNEALENIQIATNCNVCPKCGDKEIYEQLNFEVDYYSDKPLFECKLCLTRWSIKPKKENPNA